MSLIKDFEIDGRRALIVRHDTLGHLCGYIAVPPDHPLHGRQYDDDAVPDDVHGGWTYSEDHAPGEKPDGNWYFGFDCAHLGDLIPGSCVSSSGNGDVYRDEEFVEGQLRNAAPTL